jgi:hypothetical protein
VSEGERDTEKSAVGAADNEADRVEVGNTNEAAPAALATTLGRNRVAEDRRALALGREGLLLREAGTATDVGREVVVH